MKKILVVEDDPVNLQILTDYLGANGYAMRGAVNGVDGIAAFHREQPDLMLIDVQLPRKSGFEVCFELKRPGGARAVPVILMSAILASKGDQRYAAEGVHADAFLSKPFSMGQMLERIQELLPA